MDPEATLQELRDAIKEYEHAVDGDSADAEHDAANQVVDLAQELDQWISNGGFLPASWAARKE